MIVEIEVLIFFSIGMVCVYLIMWNLSVVLYLNGKWDLGDLNSIYLKECCILFKGKLLEFMLMLNFDVFSLFEYEELIFY